MQHLAIFISPAGEEFFSAYGPMTKDRAQALEYVSEQIAERAALNTLGRGETGFWRCEREHVARAAQVYQGWTFRTEPAEQPENATP